MNKVVVYFCMLTAIVLTPLIWNTDFVQGWDETKQYWSKEIVKQEKIFQVYANDAEWFLLE